MAAWFNLGLAHAWLGDNGAALEALQRYVELEADENAAGEAAALMEVLRCGQGQEDECDYQEYAFGYQFRDPQPVVSSVAGMGACRPTRPPAQPTRGHVHGPGAGDDHGLAHHGGAPAADAGRLAATSSSSAILLQFTSPLKEPFDRLRDEVRKRLALGLDELQERKAPIQFQDVTADALLVPDQASGGQCRSECWIMLRSTTRRCGFISLRRSPGG